MIKYSLLNLVFIIGLMPHYLYMSSSSILQTNSYYSEKYDYSIHIPKGFEKTKANRNTIDLKLVNNNGESIIVNVSPRTEQEYSINAHDYSSKMIENAIQPHQPDFRIIKSDKNYINGYKAFIIYYTYSSKGLKAIECYIYRDNYAFVITATTSLNEFENYENMYLSTINSLKI